MDKILIYALLAFAACFSGCDTIPLDQIEEARPKADSTFGKRTRKVFLEYFTGHTCGNCPSMGGKVLENLSKQYPNQLIVSAVHAGFFAKVRPVGQPFDFNFLTDAGTALDNLYSVSISGTPKGLINRKAVNGSVIQTPGNWSTSIASFLNDSALVGISITQKSFSPETRNVAFEASFTAFENLPFGLTSVCYLLEDSIITWQRDYSKDLQDVPDYVHRHALRAEIIASEGVVISPGNQATASQFKKLSYTYQIPSQINLKHAAFVVIAFRADTKEILQAELLKIRP